MSLVRTLVPIETLLSNDKRVFCHKIVCFMTPIKYKGDKNEQRYEVLYRRSASSFVLAPRVPVHAVEPAKWKIRDQLVMQQNIGKQSVKHDKSYQQNRM